MRRQLTRRHFLQAGMGTLGAAILAACAPKPAPSSQEPEPGEPTAVAAEPTTAPQPASGSAKPLRISAWADVQDAVVYENIVTAWHATQDEYVASVEQYPGGYYEKIQANFAADDSADALYFQGWMWQSYAENDVLAPLDDYIGRTNSQDRFPGGDNYESTTKWHGHTYMTPTDTGSLVVYYNKDLFDQAGIPYPKKGWTWEEFQDIIQKLSSKDGDVQTYGWAQAGGWNGAYGRSSCFMRRNGHIEWDQIVEPKEHLWEHEDVISALQFMIYDAIENEWSPSPDVIAGGGVGVNTGRVAMVLEGPWYMPNLWGELATQDPGINFDVVEPPVGTANRNMNFGHVHGHVISKRAKQPDGAWELVKFILSDEGQKIIAQGGRMCGTPDGIDEIWGPIASEAYNFENVEAFSNGMREGSTPIIMGEGSQLNAYGGGPITSIWDALLGLQMTAEEAIKLYGPEIQAELDNYWQERS